MERKETWVIIAEMGNQWISIEIFMVYFIVVNNYMLLNDSQIFKYISAKFAMSRPCVNPLRTGHSFGGPQCRCQLPFISYTGVATDSNDHRSIPIRSDR